MSDVFDDFKKQYPHIKAVADCNPARHLPHTLEKARETTADKLLANKAYVENGFKPAAGGEKPDKVFKRMADGTYGIGVKYGNRYLKNIFGDGRKMMEGFDKAELPSAIDRLTDCVKAGRFDDAIKEIMESNLVAKRKDDDE